MSLHHEPRRHHPQPLDSPLVRADHCSQCQNPATASPSACARHTVPGRLGKPAQSSVTGACLTGPAADLPLVLVWLLGGSTASALRAVHGLHLCGCLQVGGLPTCTREAAGGVPAGLQGRSDLVSPLWADQEATLLPAWRAA